MLVAAARLAAATRRGTGRLSLLFTADEEDGAAFGARHVAATVPLEADGVVIGEPGGIEEDYDRLHLVSRGIARMRLVASADQGHSSLVRRAAGPQRRRRRRPRRRRRARRPRAGRAAERARAARLARDGQHRARLSRRRRLRRAARARWRSTPRSGCCPAWSARAVAARVRGGRCASVELAFDEPPNDWLPRDAGRARRTRSPAAAARACATVARPRVPPPAVFPGTTDATWFSELQGIPTLPALGPGLLRRAHAADEWVSIEAVRTAVDLYTRIARGFCADMSADRDDAARAAAPHSSPRRSRPSAACSPCSRSPRSPRPTSTSATTSR